MKKIRSFLALLLVLFAASASAQTVIQSGTITAKHLPYWVTSGVIGDGGSATDSPITSIGVTNNGGAGICVSSDRQSAVGRNQLCFGASTNSAAVISLQNYGNAAAQSLNFNINGSVSIPSFVSGTPVAGDLVSFQSGQVIQDSGVAAAAGVITGGVWQGTAVAIANGGTGAGTAVNARTNLGLGTMAVQNANAVAITGGTATGLPTPTNASDVAIKSYVDATASGLIVLPATALATATVLPNTPTYANGASGVGATLTAGSNTTLTVDGTVVTSNQVVLVKNQAAPAQNGIYTLTTAGGGVPWVLTRATYFDQASEMLNASYTLITSGSANIGSSWVLTGTVTTVGTTAANFNQFGQSNSGVSSINAVTGAITLGSGLNTSGQALSNTGVLTLNSLTGAVTTNIILQKFTAAGTYTPTSGMLHAIVQCTASGGGGGGSKSINTASTFTGGGGGSGGTSTKRIVAADIVSTGTITINAGGGGGIGEVNGSAGGGVSVVSNGVTLCSANGGSGGFFGSSSQIPLGGAGGTPGSGDMTESGGPGSSGFYSANVTGTVLATSGNGGSSAAGGGGVGVGQVGVALAGNAGGAYGGGGSGAGTVNVNGTATGGAGASGVVEIIEFINM